MTQDNTNDWMAELLKLPIFQRLPPAILQKIMLTLEPADFKKGEIILEQGAAGDYYYLIKNGTCSCTRKSSPTAKAIKLRTLGAGDTFGEDALISGLPRDLTITALTDISLLRLDKQQFISLIKEPSLIFVDYTEMQEATETGLVLLDVRTPDEYQIHHLEGSVNEPFFSLRMQLKRLNHEQPYIIVCNDGKISEAAAFLLIRNNFKATILKGGMSGIPQKSENEAGGITDCLEQHHKSEAEQPAEDSAHVFEMNLKQVFFRYFEPLVDDCCMQLKLEFGLQLGNKRETMGKDQYLKLLDYLHSIREDIKENYLTKVNDIFDNGPQKNQDKTEKRLDFSNISLVSSDEVKENNAVTMVIRQNERLFHEELSGLKQLIAPQENRIIFSSQNPILPEQLIRALVDVARPLKLNTDGRIALYKTFESKVFSQLGFIYRELINNIKPSA